MNNTITYNKFKIRGFRTLDEPKLCEYYLEGHTKVLLDYDITNITSNNRVWMDNPDIYCLMIQNIETDEMMGGIRIQLANGIYPLPVEDAIGYMDDKIYTIVENYANNGGIGELSALWVDNRLRGLGVGVYLVRAAIASASQLTFKTMTGICGDVTLKMFNNVGFVTETSLGNNGQFYYPNDKLIAHVVGILDAVSLESAADYDKNIMISFRSNFIQEREECDTGKKITIDYNLIYPNIVTLVRKNQIIEIK